MARKGKGKGKGGGREPRVSLDIDGVNWNTRIGELTVSQFVEFVFQVIPQLPTTRSQQKNAATIDKVLSEIRKTITRRTEQSGGIQKAVKNAQLAILDRMPEIMKHAASVDFTTSHEEKK